MQATAKRILAGIWYSMPVQLLLLHVKRNQALLLIWLLLFAVINGSFLYSLGAHILFLYPEYLEKVNPLSAALTGGAVGIFILCWNITTFILHSRKFKFLAATAQPFLKYSINNSLIPLGFLLFYLISGIRFSSYQELLSPLEILKLSGGFVGGLFAVLATGYLYFFAADKTIYRRLSPETRQTLAVKSHRLQRFKWRNRQWVRVDWYFTQTLKLRQPRNVSHYDMEFLDRIFSQHHLAAIFSMLLVFFTLILAGLMQDNRYMQFPAAGSITVFFAILVAAVGGFSYFLGRWSLLFFGLLLFGFNGLFQKNILDPRNKAYGLSYSKPLRAPYNDTALQAACTPAHIAADSLLYIELLNNWKRRQNEKRPVMVLMAVSGGGSRSAMFTSRVLYDLDSATRGRLMQHCFLIAGASGGIMGAAWYRELYLRRMIGQLSLEECRQQSNAISDDLLNAVFSSFATRDIMAPAQYFEFAGNRYIKDRGYAFEQKLGRNTHFWMNKIMQDYAPYEAAAIIPNMLLSAVITRDGRMMYFSNHSARFLTHPGSISGARNKYPDALDARSFLGEKQIDNLSFLSALRMNATFPYVLPNVWLPTNPVVDVMDAGFRDNTGLQTQLRFAYYFRHWLQENCSRVVILQIRDKPEGGWDYRETQPSIFDLITRPAILTQSNVFRFQEYEQLKNLKMVEDALHPNFERVVFEYIPANRDRSASLSFHLTRREQMDILQSLRHPFNKQSLAKISGIIY
jgi:hypothetical protein